MPDRDTVVNRIETICEICKTNKWQTVFDSDTIYPILTDAFALLKEQEIVRCKDCKWYRSGIDIDGKSFTRCDNLPRTYGHTSPDWFCADGERKEGR